MMMLIMIMMNTTIFIFDLPQNLILFSLFQFSYIQLVVLSVICLLAVMMVMMIFIIFIIYVGTSLQWLVSNCFSIVTFPCSHF